jgi:hypothetical protein
VRERISTSRRPIAPSVRASSVPSMTDPRTMVRIELTVDGRSYYLAQDQAVDELRRRVEAAVDSPGHFISFTVVGNREVSVLITPRSRVALATETVRFDARDTGDVRDPFGEFYDFWPGE